MATKTKTPPAIKVKKPEGAQALKVIPKRDGFRRAGRAFSGETVIPMSELDDDEYAQLTAEPMLVTMVVDLPAEAEQA